MTTNASDVPDLQHQTLPSQGCAQCGYSLRGLRDDACVCPECGLSIDLTDRFQLLRRTEASWLKRLERGYAGLGFRIVVIYLSWIAVVLAVGLIEIMIEVTLDVARSTYSDRALWVIGIGILLYGVWMYGRCAMFSTSAWQVGPSACLTLPGATWARVSGVVAVPAVVCGVYVSEAFYFVSDLGAVVEEIPLIVAPMLLAGHILAQRRFNGEVVRRCAPSPGIALDARAVASARRPLVVVGLALVVQVVLLALNGVGGSPGVLLLVVVAEWLAVMSHAAPIRRLLSVELSYAAGMPDGFGHVCATTSTRRVAKPIHAMPATAKAGHDAV